MANLNRGEYELAVNDARYALALSLSDLEAIEDTLTVGLGELLTKLRMGTARSSDINKVIRLALARVRNPRLTKHDIEVVLMESTYDIRYIAAVRLLAGSLNMLEEQQETKSDDEDGQETQGETNGARPLSSAPANSTGDS